MAKFINAFTWNQAPDEAFNALVPAQQAKAREMLERGVLSHLFLAADNSGGWAVYNAESRDEVLQAIEQLPLRRFMTVDVKELQDAYSAAEARDQET